MRVPADRGRSRMPARKDVQECTEDRPEQRIHTGHRRALAQPGHDRQPVENDPDAHEQDGGTDDNVIHRRERRVLAFPGLVMVLIMVVAVRVVRRVGRCERRLLLEHGCIVDLLRQAQRNPDRTDDRKDHKADDEPAKRFFYHHVIFHDVDLHRKNLSPQPGKPSMKGQIKVRITQS